MTPLFWVGQISDTTTHPNSNVARFILLQCRPLHVVEAVDSPSDSHNQVDIGIKIEQGGEGVDDGTDYPGTLLVHLFGLQLSHTVHSVYRVH